jgi:lipopolysaccharide transport system permease protein
MGGVSSTNEQLAETEIRVTRGWAALRLGEVWRFRELLVFLTWRTILIRYKQAVMGVAWAVLQPVLMMVVYTLVFGRFMGNSSKSYGVPYAVFLYSGLLPWQFFAGGVQNASQSLVANANLLTKVYFPRLIIPMAAILAGLVDFAIAFVVLAILMAVYQIAPTWDVLWLVPLTLLGILATVAFSLWLSAFNVIYRDVQYIVPFMMQIWMFLTPLFYGLNQVPQGIWRLVFALNPMAGVIQGFRWALLGGAPPSAAILVSVVVSVVLFLTGLLYFKRVERIFADVV